MTNLIDEWNELDNEHKKFVLRVRNSNGAKRGSEPSSIETDEPICDGSEFFKTIALWRITEDSGFIECTGSYKWRTTAKFQLLERLLFGINLLD